MFEVPHWEDTPSNNISFAAVSPKVKNKSKKHNTTEQPKQPILKIPKFKAKLKLKVNRILKAYPPKPKVNKRNQLEKSNKVRQKICNSHIEEKNLDLQNNKKCSDDDIDIINYDTDKQDELILEVKKQRFNMHLNDDIEETLFKENPEDAINHSNNKKLYNNDNDIKKNSVADKDETIQTKNKDIKMKSTKKRVKVETYNNCGNQEYPFKKQKCPRQMINNDTLPENTNMLKKNIVKVKDKIDNPKDDVQNISDSKTNSSSNRKQQTLKEVNKKELIKLLLQNESNRSHIDIKGNKLRERMLERLKAAKFRYLNEKLYTSSGTDAKKLFQADPAAFQTYHEGYQQQVKKWPVKPLDVIVKRIQRMPKTHKIADMGCGEAELSRRVAQSVRSFDLVATTPGVEASDMAHTPLLSSSMDVAVYCLALMGTELTQYLVEANRVLKTGGHLLIAEVESRFQNVEHFTRDVQKLGFTLKKTDHTHKVFYFMEFTKTREAPNKKGKLPVLTLKPCIYKKR